MEGGRLALSIAAGCPLFSMLTECSQAGQCHALDDLSLRTARRRVQPFVETVHDSDNLSGRLLAVAGRTQHHGSRSEASSDVTVARPRLPRSRFQRFRPESLAPRRATLLARLGDVHALLVLHSISVRPLRPSIDDVTLEGGDPGAIEAREHAGEWCAVRTARESPVPRAAAGLSHRCERSRQQTRHHETVVR